MQEFLLGGALNFLAAVGEDIRDSIPNKDLHDGDIIQIQHDVSDSPCRQYIYSHQYFGDV